MIPGGRRFRPRSGVRKTATLIPILPMRLPRIKCPERTSIYHCTSRIHGYIPYLDDVEQDHLLRLFQEFGVFCDVEVLSYCLMDNHFHVVVAVPPRPEVLPTAEQLMARLEGLTLVGETPQSMARTLALFRKRGDVAGEKAYLDSFHRRMWDVSAYMKAAKQSFSFWHNRRHDQEGPVWKGRFHSVLVEPGDALLAVSAYVDLNPVRAGMVKTPEAHPWSGYSAAMAGSKAAQAGIQEVMSAWSGRRLEVEESLEQYRCQMYLRGEERIGVSGEVERLGLRRAEVLAMVAKQGVVTLQEYLGCRVRHFTHGLAVGSQAYVDGIFGRYRKNFGTRREGGAQPVAGLPPGILYSLRAYRRGALS